MTVSKRGSRRPVVAGLTVGTNRGIVAGVISGIIPGIILVGLLVRLFPLSRYVTPDEPVWVYRSIRFADALVAHDWAAIPSPGHPGVTTMWLGAAGVAVRRWLDPSGTDADLNWVRRLAWLSPENDEALRRLGAFLPYGRVAVAITTTLGLVAIAILTARLFGRRVTVLTVGLLAFDPFFVGHSGLLHTDALLAAWSAIAALCLLAAARGGKRAWGWSLASGAVGGLALLTKSLAVFLLPFAALVLASAWLLRRVRFSRMLSLATLWPLACAAVFVALYPAMWGTPWQTLRDLFGAPAYQSSTALMPTFFAGRVALRHGPEFYAVALPFRLSPIVLVGLFLGLRTFLARRSLRMDLIWLWLFVAGYVLLLALSVKKYDRYLLSAFPLLAVAAALGFAGRDDSSDLDATPSPHSGEVGAGEPSGSVRLPLLRRSTVAPVLLQLLLFLPFAAYPLTSFNLLLGGPWVAARLLPVDWGEGMGAAARWLNERPDARQSTVAALSVPSFAPLFVGHTVSLDQASLADYAVVGAHEGVIPSDGAPGQALAHAVRLGFLTHAAVMTNTLPLEQAAYLATRVGPEDAVLLDAETPLLRRYDGPGKLVSVAELPDASAVAARVADVSAGRSRLWVVADPSAAPITAAHLRQGLTALATLVASDTVGGAVISQFTVHGSPETTGYAQLASFGGQIDLVDALLPTAPMDSPFPIYLRWRVPGPTPTGLHASLYLRDADDHLWAEAGHPIVNGVTFPTSTWAPGEWADDRVTVQPPELIPPGEYGVDLTVTSADGKQLGAWDTDGRFRGVRLRLGYVEIAPPAEPRGADCTGGNALAAGDLLACVPLMSPQAAPSGGTLTLSLTWSALWPPEGDYDVRWRLVDARERVVLEDIVAVAPYATSRWRAGDRFETRYDLWLNPAVPAGTHRLVFNVLLPGGRPLWDEDEPVTEVEVLPRERSFDLPDDIAHPLELRLGDVAHLRGFEINPDTSCACAEGGLLYPGDTIDLTLYWQAEGPADLDYTVFVHFLGPDRRPHGQVDRPPAAGSAPTTSWAPGQVVVDTMSLSVAADAPPGMYRVAVGMYDAATGGRLPVTDASGRALPDDQAILPIVFTVAGSEP